VVDTRRGGVEAVSAIRLLVDDPQPGVRNMAVDEALMRSAGDTGDVTLRLYRWEPGCLSFGRNQEARGAYDPGAAADLGIDVVRRPTGGRSVYHHRELTYSVTAPAGTWGSLRESYRRINGALAVGLRELGVPADTADEQPGAAGDRSATTRPVPRPTPRACFRDPLPGEVTVAGRKLVGSAQWRDGGAFLQHGSILLVDEQPVVDALRIGGGDVAGERSSGGIALDDVLDEPPSEAALLDALARGFELEFGAEVVPGRLTAQEAAEATAMAPRFADPAWTWRR